MITYDNLRTLLIKLRIREPSPQNYGEFDALAYKSLVGDGLGGTYTLSIEKPHIDMRIGEFVRAIYSFAGEYRWLQRGEGMERKLDPWSDRGFLSFLRRKVPDIMLVVEAVLPTEAEQIRTNFGEFDMGMIATRARVVTATADSELDGRQIWFTKRVGKNPIYTQQRARIDLGSGMNQLVLE